MRKRNTGFRKFSAIVFSAILVLAMSITAFAETGSHDAGNTQDSASADVTKTMAGDEDGAVTVTDEPGAGSDVTPADPEVPAGTAVQQGTGDASAPAESEAGGAAVTPTEDTTGTETIAPVEGTETPATEPMDVTPADVTEAPALPGEDQTEAPADSASAGNTSKPSDAAASDVSIVPADEDELQDEDPDAVSPDEEGDTENTDPDMSDEAAALQARIDALPSVEELAGMGDEELEALYAEVTEILALAEGLALDTAKLDAIAAFFSPEAMLTGTLTGSGTEADPYIAVDQATLNEAVGNGGYVRLGQGISIDAEIYVSSDVTLDLAGNALDVSKTTYGFRVYESGKLTIRDSSGQNGMITGNSVAVLAMGSAEVTLESGTITANASAGLAAVHMQGAVTFNMTGGSIETCGTAVNGLLGAALNLSGGKISTRADTNEFAAVSLTGGTVNIQGSIVIESAGYGIGLQSIDYGGVSYVSEAEMTGGEIRAGFQGIGGNNTKSAGTIARINGGVITAGMTGIYWPMEGTLTVGGTAQITGGTGIEAKIGTLHVEGGTITGNSAPADAQPESGGSSPEGSAILLSAQMYDSYGGNADLTVTVKNAKLVSTQGYGIRVYNTGKRDHQADISIENSVEISAAKAPAVLATADGVSTRAIDDLNQIHTVQTGNTTLQLSGITAPVYSTQGNKTVYYTGVQDAVADGATEITVFGIASADASLLNSITLKAAPGGKLTITGQTEGQNIIAETDADGYTQYRIGTDTDTYVAAVNGIGYKTLASAVANANGETVVLQENVTESITIPAGADITLDLNGKTLTNTNGQHTITNKGTLRITGDGTVDNVSHNRQAVRNEQGGIATIDGGTYTRSQEKGAKNPETGKLESNGNSSYVIYNAGTMTIAGGEVIGTSGYSSLVCNGSNKEPGVMTISGGTLSQPSYNALINYPMSTLTITEGADIAGDPNSSAATFYGTVTMTGGSIRDGEILIAPAYTDTNVTITGGTIACTNLKMASFTDQTTWNGSGRLDISGNTQVTGTIVTGTTLSTNMTGAFVPDEQANTGRNTVVISGGTFSQDVTDYLADGYEVEQDGNGMFTVQDASITPEPEPTPTPEPTPAPEPGAGDNTVTPPSSDTGAAAGNVYYPPAYVYYPPSAPAAQDTTATVAAAPANTAARPAAAAQTAVTEPADDTDPADEPEEIADNEVPAAAPEDADASEENGTADDELVKVEEDEVPLASGETQAQASSHWFGYLIALFAAAAVIFFFILLMKRRKRKSSSKDERMMVMKAVWFLMLLICIVLTGMPVWAQGAKDEDSAISQPEDQKTVIITVVSEETPEVPLAGPGQEEHPLCMLHGLLFAAAGVTGICGAAGIQKKRKRLAELQARYHSVTGWRDSDH